MSELDTLLVSTEWLAEHLESPELVVLDCTVWLDWGDDGWIARSGREHWEAAHIPGAGFADLTGDLCDADSPLRFAVPTPAAFCDAMGRLGVGDSSQVVLYDANSAMWAARVWWMLRWAGFDRAAILDGGFDAWKNSGSSVTTEVVAPTPQVLTPRPRPELVADRREVQAAIDNAAVCLIDALPEAVYRGDVSAYRRPGHIPGATNTPAAGLIDPDTGRFRPRDELRAQFPADSGKRTITYCGGGIAASADAFALTLLGHRDVAVYAASLQEWADDPDAPLVTGPS